MTQVQDELSIRLKDYQDKVSQLQSSLTENLSQIDSLKAQESEWKIKNQEFIDSIQRLNNSLQEKDMLISDFKQAQEKVLKKHTSNILEAKDYNEKLIRLQAERDSLVMRLERLKSEEASWLNKNKGIIRFAGGA